MTVKIKIIINQLNYCLKKNSIKIQYTTNLPLLGEPNSRSVAYDEKNTQLERPESNYISINYIAILKIVTKTIWKVQCPQT